MSIKKLFINSISKDHSIPRNLLKIIEKEIQRELQREQTRKKLSLTNRFCEQELNHSIQNA